MSKFNPVIAETESQYKQFKELIFQSGEDAKLTRLFSAKALYGTRPRRLVVLPGGWHSILQGDKNLITAFCARNQISIYNVTQSKIDQLTQLVEKEKAKDAKAKAYSEGA